MRSALLLILVASVQVLPPNLVQNGDARAGTFAWTTGVGPRQATVETCDGSPCFVMRNGTSWTQSVELPPDSAGKFVLLVGRGSSERLIRDGTITGLPYLWALPVTLPPTRFLASLQGQDLLARPAANNDWVIMSGIFELPADARFLQVKLAQASSNGTPQNGSAARIKDVELRIFSTEAEAREYLAAFSKPE